MSTLTTILTFFALFLCAGLISYCIIQERKIRKKRRARLERINKAIRVWEELK